MVLRSRFMYFDLYRHKKKLLLCVSAADRNREDKIDLLDTSLQAETNRNSKSEWPRNHRNKSNHRFGPFIDLRKSMLNSLRSLRKSR